MTDSNTEKAQQLLDSLFPDHLCHCGSCQEAVDAAMKTAMQLLEHQCPVWLLQVSIAQALIANAAMTVSSPNGQDVTQGEQNYISAIMSRLLLKDSEGLAEKLVEVLSKK